VSEKLPMEVVKMRERKLVDEIERLQKRVAELDARMVIKEQQSFHCKTRKDAEPKLDDAADEIERLTARVMELEGLCVSSRKIINNAILHGMPVTQQVANARNELVKIKEHYGDPDNPHGLRW